MILYIETTTKTLHDSRYTHKYTVTSGVEQNEPRFCWYFSLEKKENPKRDRVPNGVPDLMVLKTMIINMFAFERYEPFFDVVYRTRAGWWVEGRRLGILMRFFWMRYFVPANADVTTGGSRRSD